MHYGLLPRANRGIFAINELPDLAGKIQVGLFNILQEGDVQIKGYPVRLPLDVLMVVQRQPRGLHRARQDHHAAEGPHRLRDPHALPGDAPARDGDHRAGGVGRTARQRAVQVPDFVREVVEEIAFQAREDKKIDKRSGVSQRLPISLLENVVSNAERRALLAGEDLDRPARHRHLRGAAGDHRQVRAGVRRRAARRRQRRARHHPRRGRQRLHRLLRRRRPAPGHRVVRSRRHAADRRRRCRRRSCCAAPPQVPGAAAS